MIQLSLQGLEQGRDRKANARTKDSKLALKDKQRPKPRTTSLRFTP